MLQRKEHWRNDGLINVVKNLQVIEYLLQLVARLLVQALSYQEGQLVSVLAGGGNPHSPRPVEVEVCELVGQLLKQNSNREQVATNQSYTWRWSGFNPEVSLMTL